MSWGWNVACMGKMRNAYKVLVGKPEMKTSLQRQAYMGGKYVS
jgi:hypothetical protein